MLKFIVALDQFRKDEKGVTLVEYGIALILAITLGGGALALLAGEVGTQMGDAQLVMQN